MFSGAANLLTDCPTHYTEHCLLRGDCSEENLAQTLLGPNISWHDMIFM